MPAFLDIDDMTENIYYYNVLSFKNEKWKSENTCWRHEIVLSLNTFRIHKNLKIYWTAMVKLIKCFEKILFYNDLFMHCQLLYVSFSQRKSCGVRQSGLSSNWKRNQLKNILIEYLTRYIA